MCQEAFDKFRMAFSMCQEAFDKFRMAFSMCQEAFDKFRTTFSIWWKPFDIFRMLLRVSLRDLRASALRFPLQETASSDSSQSFHTGSRFCPRSMAAISAGLRVSWI
jgi:hypothetical protein